jgi:hypothetical protein
MKRFGGFWKVGFGALAAVALVVTPFGAASAQEEVQHGIGFTKGCLSPVTVGSPYRCAYAIRNIVDGAEDTLTIHSLIDTVHAASGDQTTGNLLPLVKLDSAGTNATCNGSGAGTLGNPWTGSTSCTLPFNAIIHVQLSSQYTVQAGDFNLPNHVLTDSATLGWNDVCNDPAQTGNSNCNPNPPPTSAASQAVVNQAAVSITTLLSPAAAVQTGTSVTDQATLHGSTAGATGTVSYAVYSDDTCETLVKSLGTKTVSNGGVGPSDAWVATVGDFWFQAVYSGDAAHSGATSDCTTEPIHVTSSPPVTQESPGTSTTVAATAELPRTGSGPVGAQILFALAIVGLGVFLLTASRRRHRQAR